MAMQLGVGAYYVEAFQKYAEFQGRARRKEFWYFSLFNFVAAFVLTLFLGPIAGLYQLAVFLPATAIGVRRLHDTGRSGWWLLLPIVNIVFLAEDGARGDNRFGPDPKVLDGDVGPQAALPARAAAVSMSSIDQIERLAALRDRGILTDDEFVTKKAALL